MTMTYTDTLHERLTSALLDDSNATVEVRRIDGDDGFTAVELSQNALRTTVYGTHAWTRLHDVVATEVRVDSAGRLDDIHVTHADGTRTRITLFR
jgi:hypothetical protein